MEAIWLPQYPEGVPAEIDIARYTSLVDILERAIVAHRDRIAFENLGATLSYGDVDRLSQDFASYLQNRLGLAKGDRIALMLPNLLQYPVAMIGALRAGIVIVNLNPMAAERELRAQLEDSGARVVVVAEPYAHTLSRVLEHVQIAQVITTSVGDLQPLGRRILVNARVRHLMRAVPSWRIRGHVPFRVALARGHSQPFNRCVLTHEDLAFLQYTGGTTGAPMGVELSHGNMVANVMQARAWIAPWAEEGRERILTALPLHHIFALTANCLVFFSLGAENALIANPRDRAGMVKELARRHFTAITGVNTLFSRLLNTPGFGNIDFSTLKFTLGGGAAVQAAVAHQWQSVTGRALTEAYGLTEAAPAVAMNPLSAPEYNGSVGLPLPSTEISIRSTEGRELGIDTAGELCVRGPQVMRGYWRRPEATRAAFTEDGYLRTGDIATIDAEGFIRIIDRCKDVIIVSGLNVYPNEVEEVAIQCDGVRECACVGVPDADTDEAVKLYVVRADESLSAEQIYTFCESRLSRYKLPRSIVFVEELPKSDVGKVLRKQLRDR
ncbi:AMP-binding protein [Algiphilus sp.]|uniref:AMP-binding protein n=1 Tax=Algiphilus sp. TaxID=1872431 RepID=UPI001CA75636|nr:AMP-binding protein [Algiphilus sp.]MBY8966303.1 AMP-binding protein [Algiphilus acroporae]MCI5061510.1 AMP-binding protein [Algiphilus sp.]MCI5102236.1 AMP-binding protein [Algiphilus sp.]